MRITIAAFIIGLYLFLAWDAYGQDLPQGQTTSGGLVSLGNGFYQWHDGTTYRRVLVTTPGRWVSGCYTPGYQQYQYYAAALPTPPPSITNVVNNITPTNPDWRSQLLGVVQQREKYAAQAQKAAVEALEFQQAIAALGLNGAPYGGTYANGYSVSGGIVNYGASANTQFGYGATYNQLASIYSQTDLNVLYQQAAALTQQAQTLGGSANNSFMSLVSQQGTNQAKLAEIYTKGEQFKGMLQILNSPSVIRQGFKFTVEPNGVLRKDDANVPRATKESNLEAFGSLASAKCGACHLDGGAGFKSFDLNRYLSMSPKDKQLVFSSITNPDPNRRMPLSLKDGQVLRPGTPLTDEEKALFFTN